MTPAELARKELEKRRKAGPEVGNDPASLASAELNRRAQGRRAPAARLIDAGVGAVANQTKNTLSGFYQRAGEILAVPVGVVGSALQAAGKVMGLSEATSTPDAVFKSNQGIQAFFQAVGLTDPARQDSFMAAIGREGAAGAATALATGPLGPALSAVTRSGVVGEAARTMGQFITKTPGTFVASEVGAAAGAEAGENLAGVPQEGDGFFSKIGRSVAPFAGGVAGGTVGMGVGRGGSNIAKGVGGLFKRGTPNAAPEEPIRPFGADPALAQDVARRTYDADLQRLDADTQRIIQSVGGATDSETGSVSLNRALAATKKMYRDEESTKWGRVALRNRTKADRTLQFIETEIARLRDDNPRAVPEELIDEFYRLATRELPNGSRVVRVVPAERLRNLRGYIRDDRWTEETGEGGRRTPNQARIRIMNQIEDLILDDIRAGLTPAQQAKFDEAREFSKELNQLFRQGPVSDVLARGTGSGEPRIQPEETMKKVLRDPQGVKLTRAAGEGSVPNPQIVQEMESTVRAMFREAAETDPRRGKTWLRQNESRIKPLATALADIQTATQGLATTLETRTALTRSALAKFSAEGVNPEAKISGLFSSQKPGFDARQLKAAVRSDPDALEGLQAAVIDAFMSRSNASGLRAAGLMENPRVREVVEEILDPDQLRAFKEVINLTAAIESGHENSARRIFGPIGYVASRIMGAKIGRNLDSLLGQGHTIQTPGFVARAFGQAFDAALSRVSPQTLFKAAVLSPDGRALLQRRGPSTISEIRQLARRANRLVGGEAGLIERIDRDDAGEGEAPVDKALRATKRGLVNVGRNVGSLFQ